MGTGLLCESVRLKELMLVLEILLNVAQDRLGVAVVRLGTAYYDSRQGDGRYGRGN